MAKQSTRSWPAGKRVRFKPNVVSLAMYSAAPAPGTVGKVIAVSLGSKKATYLPGPGGGLVYVDWDTIGVMGVSPIDLEPVTQKSREANPQDTHRPDETYPVIDPSKAGLSWSSRALRPSDIQIGDVLFMKNLPHIGYGSSDRTVVATGPKNVTTTLIYMTGEVLKLKVPRHDVAYLVRDGKVYVVREPARCNPDQPPDANPVLTDAERAVLPASAFADPKNRRFPIHDMVHARAAVGKLNLWFNRGKISKEQYKEYYAKIMKAYSKFGMTAQKSPLVKGLRVIAGKKKTSGAKPGLKMAVGQNPTPTGPGIRFPLRNSLEAKSAIVILNNFYLKGKISDDEYRQLYEVIAASWKKFGVKGVPTNELQTTPASNPRRHLPVLQPYSPEWRERRRQGIASENPAAKVQRNDPSAVRAIMMRVMAQPNPVGDKGGAQMAMRISAAEIGMETSRIGKNVSSLDPMEYYDVFLGQGKDPDAAMASLEDMAAWGVTDVI